MIDITYYLDINNLKKFYKDKKKKYFLIIMFIIIMLTYTLVDIRYNPYPPKIAFIENGMYIKGGLYLDNKYIGKMRTAFYGNLPDSYCKGNHTLVLETETETFSWKTDPSHCESNMVKFEVRG